MRLNPLAISLAALIFAGCATHLTENAQQVRLITAEEKTRCAFLGVVITEVRAGRDKPGNALRKALNEVASRGGNGLYMSSQTIDWAEGASVTGEALKCGDKSQD